MEGYKMNISLKERAYHIRQNILDMTFHAKSGGGHIGGALSCSDIMAVLFGEIINLNPSNTLSDDRDRFILSKGHVALALYATLCEYGFITKEEIMTFEDSGSLFPTHTYMNQKIGIETSSGSLGYGLSIACGIALASKLKSRSNRVFTLLGDGECNEGSVWEAAMNASKLKLDNLVAIVDINKQQNDGFTSNILPIQSFEDVFRGFGWNVISINGHDCSAISKALKTRVPDKPTVILADTIKGKGIPSIEGKVGWHHTRINEEQYLSFMKELENTK